MNSAPVKRKLNENEANGMQRQDQAVAGTNTYLHMYICMHYIKFKASA